MQCPMPDAQSWEQLANQFEALDPYGGLLLIWNRNRDGYVFGYAWSEVSVFFEASMAYRNTDSHHDLVAAKFRAYATRPERRWGFPKTRFTYGLRRSQRGAK